MEHGGSLTVPNVVKNYISMIRRILYYNFGLRELKWMIFNKSSDGIMSVTVGNTECEFIVSNKVEYHRFSTTVGEYEILNDLLSELEPNDVFLDVGANVGLYTCLVGERLKTGEVIAFEPHPVNHARLVENIDLNKQSARVERIGLSNRRETTQMSVGRNIAGAGGPQIDVGDSLKETISIEIMSGDMYFLEREIRPDIIKIDVEGHEYHVLDGLKKTLESNPCRAIYCEIHPDKLQRLGHNTTDIIDLLSDLGYNVKKMPMDRFMIKAVYNDL